MEDEVDDCFLASTFRLSVLASFARAVRLLRYFERAVCTTQFEHCSRRARLAALSPRLRELGTSAVGRRLGYFQPRDRLREVRRFLEGRGLHRKHALLRQLLPVELHLVRVDCRQALGVPSAMQVVPT